jgi:hypothetical protein
MWFGFAFTPDAPRGLKHWPASALASELLACATCRPLPDDTPIADAPPAMWLKITQANGGTTIYHTTMEFA